MFWLRTGIGVKKFVHPDDMGKGDNNEDLIKKKVEPAIRYAEVLLIYAEALNELGGQYDIPSWDGSKTHMVKRDINEMKKVFVLYVFVRVYPTIPRKNMIIRQHSARN